MFETIALLVAGAIVASVIQSTKRGRVSIEEKKNNPTLIESMTRIANEAADYSEKLHAKTKFEIKYCSWFKTFEQSVSSALEDAEYYANLKEVLKDFPESVLDDYPELSVQYKKSIETLKEATQLPASFSEKMPPRTEPDWVRQGPPPMPENTSHPEMDAIYKEAYASRLKQHEDFLQETRDKLRRKPVLYGFFHRHLAQGGLGKIYSDYFLAGNEKSPKPIPFAGSSSKLTPTAKLFLAETAEILSERVQHKNDNFTQNAENTYAIRAENKIELTEHRESSKRTRPGEESRRLNVLDISRMYRGNDFARKLRPKSQGEGGQHNKIRTDKNSSEIRALTEELGVPHLVHFTRCDNLSSILRHGLQSVSSCDTGGIRAVRNDTMRLDGQLDGISLSITSPNFRMFYKYRQLDSSADWAVLLLSPAILWELSCGFYRHNAADARMRHLPRKKMETVPAFREMFAVLDTPREPWLRRYDPTDPQAEVMVYETIPARFIETIAFETKSASEEWEGAVGGIDRIYAGPGQGLFGTRAKLRQN